MTKCAQAGDRVEAGAPSRNGACAHTSQLTPPTPVTLWIELGGKSKWLPLNLGYHDVMSTAPILIYTSQFNYWCLLVLLFTGEGPGLLGLLR